MFSSWTNIKLLSPVVQHQNPTYTSAGLHHSVWRRLSNQSHNVSGPAILYCVELNRMLTSNIQMYPQMNDIIFLKDGFIQIKKKSHFLNYL